MVGGLAGSQRWWPSDYSELIWVQEHSLKNRCCTVNIQNSLGSYREPFKGLNVRYVLKCQYDQTVVKCPGFT